MFLLNKYSSTTVEDALADAAAVIPMPQQQVGCYSPAGATLRRHLEKEVSCQSAVSVSSAIASAHDKISTTQTSHTRNSISILSHTTESEDTQSVVIPIDPAVVEIPGIETPASTSGKAIISNCGIDHNAAGSCESEEEDSDDFFDCES